MGTPAKRNNSRRGGQEEAVKKDKKIIIYYYYSGWYYILRCVLDSPSFGTIAAMQQHAGALLGTHYRVQHCLLKNGMLVDDPNNPISKAEAVPKKYRN